VLEPVAPDSDVIPLYILLVRLHQEIVTNSPNVRNFEYLLTLIGALPTNIKQEINWLNDITGDSPLTAAATHGNWDAAIKLMYAFPELVELPSKTGHYPVDLLFTQITSTNPHRDEYEKLVLACLLELKEKKLINLDRIGKNRERVKDALALARPA
jgi:hypothetical protein